MTASHIPRSAGGLGAGAPDRRVDTGSGAHPADGALPVRAPPHDALPPRHAAGSPVRRAAARIRPAPGDPAPRPSARSGGPGPSGEPPAPALRPPPPGQRTRRQQPVAGPARRSRPASSGSGSDAGAGAGSTARRSPPPSTSPARPRCRCRSPATRPPACRSVSGSRRATDVRACCSGSPRSWRRPRRGRGAGPRCGRARPGGCGPRGQGCGCGAGASRHRPARAGRGSVRAGRGQIVI